ncbi:YeeE/YedE family protein [Paracoccus caeni]|uniref:YeeE/YedE family protein n=1 Tax=Paracoccus caeni TaxID=657651 RepID=A0A934VZK7_9RHOB|nr:YeeE/YedE family protein [Paracoccus caeni]MBK4217142.1 YeeE/YedE family protein [Paracoccus caeni]
MTLTSRPFVAIFAALALIVLYLNLPDRDALGRSLPVSLLLGGAFGLVLQRSRFCFWCISRDWFADRDPRGLLGILAALAVGIIGYAAIFGVWLPNPASGRLPPDAHIGPVSITMIAGSFVFGIGMALSGSCISAHFYRLGEGAFGSVIALLGAFIGFGLGFLSWNTLYVLDIYRAKVIWLPTYLGHGGALLVSLGLLGVAALWLLCQPMPAQPEDHRFVLARRWPAVVGGILVGWIAMIAYFRVGPLGVTAELGSLARTSADAVGWLPQTLHGLDSFAGCATVVKEALFSRNGVFVIGMVLASAVSATLAGDWKPAPPAIRTLPRLFIGGLMLGWGAMVALGCTVGVLLSGIMAGALSGWVFLVACFAGAWIGWHLRGK